MLVKDYTGQVFNNRKIVSFIKRDKRGNAVWRCECCKCGRRAMGRISLLRQRSCNRCCKIGRPNIKRRRDHTGWIVNNRRILSCWGKNKYGKTIWNYECLKCGRKGRNRLAMLKTRKCRFCSLGAIASNTQEYLGFGEISQPFYLRLFRSSYYRKRKLEFSVTAEYLWNIYLQQGGRCGLTGREIGFDSKSAFSKKTTASLDRIDSSKGYIPGNVWWIHKDLQTVKMDFSLEEIINICKEVVAHYARAPRDD